MQALVTWLLNAEDEKEELRPFFMRQLMQEDQSRVDLVEGHSENTDPGPSGYPAGCPAPLAHSPSNIPVWKTAVIYIEKTRADIRLFLHNHSLMPCRQLVSFF